LSIDWNAAKPCSSTPGSAIRPVGNQRSLVANSMIMRSPNQKVGIAYRIIPKLVDATSKVPLRLHPAKTPMIMPRMVAKTVPTPTSRTVGQMRSATTSVTGRFSANDMPNSPRIVSRQ